MLETAGAGMLNLEELCTEISDFCLPKMAPELNREASLWVSGFLGVQKSDFWRPSAATLNLRFVAVSLGVERSDFWRPGVEVGVFAPPLELSEEFSLDGVFDERPGEFCLESQTLIWVGRTNIPWFSAQEK